MGQIEIVARGKQGLPGARGWSPVFNIIDVNGYKYLKIVNWIGGELEKPAVDLFLTAAGDYTTNINDAVPFVVPPPPGGDEPAGFRSIFIPAFTANAENGCSYICTAPGTVITMPAANTVSDDGISFEVLFLDVGNNQIVFPAGYTLWAKLGAVTGNDATYRFQTYNATNFTEQNGPFTITTVPPSFVRVRVTKTVSALRVVIF